MQLKPPPPSFSVQKNRLRRIGEGALSANWTLRAVFRAIRRALTPRQIDRASRLAAIAISLVFFSLFPTLVFTSYMSWEGFFSYDMFREGTSGVAAFYWWGEVGLLVSAFYIAGSLYPVAQSKLKHNRWLPVRSLFFWFLLILNLIMLAILLGQEWKRTDGLTKWHLLWLCMVAAWAVAHFGIVFNGSGKLALVSIALGALGLSTLAMLNPGVFALPYKLSLQFFGVGGGLDASIRMARSGALIEGRLVLASPENIYISLKGQNRLFIINRRDVEVLSIANLGGFGHGKPEPSGGVLR